MMANTLRPAPSFHVQSTAEPRFSQWTLRSLLAVVILGAIVICLAVPTAHQAHKRRQEREASAKMKTLAAAEADFRSNDRDNDRAQNFWTRDVVGLYSLSPSTDGVTVPSPNRATMLRLIEPSTAAADVTGFGDATPGVVPHEAAFGPWSPRNGYVYRAFTDYHVGMGTAPYGVRAGIDAWGDTRNFGKYAFMALPVDPSEASTIYILDETITIFRFSIDEGYRGAWRDAGRAAHFEWSGARMLRDTPFPSAPGGPKWAIVE